MKKFSDIRVFILDDDLIQLNLLEQQLLELGVCNVLTFRNEEDFLQKLYAQPEIVFISTYSERFDAFSICNQMKKRELKTKFVFILLKKDVQKLKEKNHLLFFDYILKDHFQPTKTKQICNEVIKSSEKKPRIHKQLLKLLFLFFKK
jgi:DNA-binding NtrC family response regulator